MARPLHAQGEVRLCGDSDGDSSGCHLGWHRQGGDLGLQHLLLQEDLQLPVGQRQHGRALSHQVPLLHQVIWEGGCCLGERPHLPLPVQPDSPQSGWRGGNLHPH